MKQETSNTLKKEIIGLAITYVVALIAFKIAFYKQDMGTIFSLVTGLYWLFVVPGVAILFLFRESFDQLTRFVIGSATGFAVMGALSYYVGLFGVHIQHHKFILPVLIILAVVGIEYHREKKKH